MSSLEDNEILQKNIDKMFQLVELFPEDAITNARSVLESAYKIILDAYQIEYRQNEKVPKLRKKVMECLKLNVNTQDNTNKIGEISIKILSGLEQIAQGMDELRNSFSSTHGAGARQIDVPIRYAKLAAKSSEMITEFLFLTLDDRQGGQDEN